MYSKVEIDQSQAAGAEPRYFGEFVPGVKRVPAFYQQKVYVFKSGSKYPIEMTIRLPEGVFSYPPGFYLLDLESKIVPDKYGQPAFAAYSEYALIPVSTQFVESYDKMEKSFYEQLNKYFAAPLAAVS